MGQTTEIRRNRILILIDLFVMGALILNLTLIIFDWIFGIEIINQLMEEYLPAFYTWYDTYIHQHFTAIDLGFIMIFLGEFTLSWIIAIATKSYARWYLYPVFHWYDLVGCIPIGSFRFVRVLRVFSILVRLQNLGLIDIQKFYLYQQVSKYYSIVVEEISNRVVVNVLSGIQDEVKEGGPMVRNVIDNVIRPKQDLLVTWLSNRIANAIQTNIAREKEEIQVYVDELITAGLKKSSKVKLLEKVPVMGKPISDAIDETVSEVVYNIIESALSDIASGRNKVIVREGLEIVLDAIEMKSKSEEVGNVFIDISTETIELIKEQVRIQKWKLKNETEKDADSAEKAGVDLLLTDD